MRPAGLSTCGYPLEVLRALDSLELYRHDVAGGQRNNVHRSQDDGRVRVDNWLWATRFFKTRAAATEAVLGGRVRVNGRVPSPFGYRASAFEGTKRY